MKKNLSDTVEKILLKSSNLAHFVNLVVVFFIVVFLILIDNELLKSFLIFSMSIVVVLSYYLKVNFMLFEEKVLVLNEFVCLILWTVISAFWFAKFFFQL